MSIPRGSRLWILVVALLMALGLTLPAHAADRLGQDGGRDGDKLSLAGDQLVAAFPRPSPALRHAWDAYFQGIRASGEYDRLVNKHYPGTRGYSPALFARNA